jgi:copper chaperone CopZ
MEFKMKNEVIKIEGMHCDHCVMVVKKNLSKLDLNLKDVKIGSAEVEYDENKVNYSQIKNAVENAGYTISEN